MALVQFYCNLTKNSPTPHFISPFLRETLKKKDVWKSVFLKKTAL